MIGGKWASRVYVLCGLSSLCNCSVLLVAFVRIVLVVLLVPLRKCNAVTRRPVGSCARTASGVLKFPTDVLVPPLSSDNGTPPTEMELGKR